MSLGTGSLPLKIYRRADRKRTALVGLDIWNLEEIFPTLGSAP